MANDKTIDALFEGFQGVLGKGNQNVKIFKSANDKSILDVTAALDFHKANNKGEDVYKGKVIFSITDITKNSYLKAFVDKSKVKVLAQSIIDHTFNTKVFKGGFTDFGGTVSSDPSKLRSRILKISLTDRGQFVFNIDEGKGTLADKGAIKMVGKPEVSVTRYVPYEEALQMAHEVYDYIRDQEMLALMKGKPLFTISKYEANKITEVTQQAENTAPVEETKTEVKAEGKPYTIQVDPWKGKTMAELSNEELKYILEKTQGIEQPIAKELNAEAMNEVKKRMANRSAS